MRTYITAALCALLCAPAFAADLPPASVCEITGTVAAVETVSRPPWNDGTPSPLAVTEIRVTVTVDKRFPHRRTPGAACAVAAGASLTYKLCSPVLPEKGSRIRASEGAPPIATADAVCLFDVALLPDAARE